MNRKLATAGALCFSLAIAAPVFADSDSALQQLKYAAKGPNEAAAQFDGSVAPSSSTYSTSSSSGTASGNAVSNSSTTTTATPTTTTATTPPAGTTPAK